jgi:hypothetical protein
LVCTDAELKEYKKTIKDPAVLSLFKVVESASSGGSGHGAEKKTNVKNDKLKGFKMSDLPLVAIAQVSYFHLIMHDI